MTEALIRYGDSPRGVVFADVSHAADELLRLGERPTVERIRAKIGSGSPNTVGPLLDRWWKSLATRLDNGPAAFHRVPESVSHIAEALWLQALEEARARAMLEQSNDRRGVAQDQERIEARAHVLSLREAEMESRIKGRDKSIADLETRVQLLATSLRREQAGRNELARKLAAIESRPAPPLMESAAAKPKKRLRKAKAVRRAVRKTSAKAKPKAQRARPRRRP